VVLLLLMVVNCHCCIYSVIIIAVVLSDSSLPVSGINLDWYTSLPMIVLRLLNIPTLSCKIVGTDCSVFKTCQLHLILYFVNVEKDFMANPLPPESVLFNVSFHTKTSNRRNNIESGEGGFEKKH